MPCASGLIARSGTVSALGETEVAFPAFGATAVALAPLVAFGFTVLAFADPEIAFGLTDPCVFVTAFGVVRTTGALAGILADGPTPPTAGPTPPTARPRCAKPTPVINPSTTPQISILFILVLTLLSLCLSCDQSSFKGAIGF